MKNWGLNIGLAISITLLLTFGFLNSCLRGGDQLQYHEFEHDIVKLKFSEPMDTVGLFDINNYLVQHDPNFDGMPNRKLEVYEITTDLPLDSIVYVYVWTEKHPYPTTTNYYVIGVTDVTDLAGNMIHIEKNYAIYARPDSLY